MKIKDRTKKTRKRKLVKHVLKGGKTEILLAIGCSDETLNKIITRTRDFYKKGAEIAH